MARKFKEIYNQMPAEARARVEKRVTEYKAAAYPIGTRTTSQLFREILAGAESDLNALECQKSATDDRKVPTIGEIAAIDRIQKIIRGCSKLIEMESTCWNREPQPKYPRLPFRRDRMAVQRPVR